MEEVGYVATIGMFDGVHRGHQFVLEQVTIMARQRGLCSMAITFDHTLRNEQVLTPLAKKKDLLALTGVDCVEVLPFSSELKAMSAQQFMEKVLKGQLHVKVLLVGYDNRFGHRSKTLKADGAYREEGFEDYVRYGRELGIEVLQLPAEGSVSSSLIRRLLREGKVDDAAQNLGYPYALTGRVAHGEHIGRQLGFPTANLVPVDANQLVPASGVYAVKVKVMGDEGEKCGMMNIGHRPTFNGHTTTLEVHIFQMNADLYGRQLTVSFVSRLRKEQRFDTFESLKEQLNKDAVQAQQILL